jgi:hypothetical protein
MPEHNVETQESDILAMTSPLESLLLPESHVANSDALASHVSRRMLSSRMLPLQVIAEERMPPPPPPPLSPPPPALPAHGAQLGSSQSSTPATGTAGAPGSSAVEPQSQAESSLSEGPLKLPIWQGMGWWKQDKGRGTEGQRGTGMGTARWSSMVSQGGYEASMEDASATPGRHLPSRPPTQVRSTRVIGEAVAGFMYTLLRAGPHTDLACMHAGCLQLLLVCVAQHHDAVSSLRITSLCRPHHKSGPAGVTRQAQEAATAAVSMQPDQMHNDERWHKWQCLMHGRCWPHLLRLGVRR